LFAAAGYFVGSIPFGYLLGKRRGIDIRAHGSGNIGATNVGRVLGKGAGRLCLVLDMGKGLAPTLVAGLVHGVVVWGALPSGGVMWWWMVVAACCVLGHMFPVYLRGKGGKGVATGFGAMLGMSPVLTLAGLGSLVVFVVCVRVTRMVGVSSCAAVAVLPVLVVVSGMVVVGGGGWDGGGSAVRAVLPWVVSTCVLGGLVIYKHRGNLLRTWRGTEPRIGEAGGGGVRGGGGGSEK